MPKRPPIRVFHVITRMDMGGSAQNTLLTCRGLADRYAVTLAFGPTAESRMTEAERAQVEAGLDDARRHGVRTLLIPSLVRPIDPVQDALALMEIYRWIRRLAPDIVHTHTSKAGLLGRLAARLARVPKVVHTAHGHVFYGHFGRLLTRLFLVIERLADRITDRQVALTRGEGADDLRLKVTRPEKLVTIHSGVDVARFAAAGEENRAARSDFGLPEAVPIVGFVGWLIPVKGPEVLLDAMGGVWANHPSAVLAYVGKGEMETELRQRVRDEGLPDRVCFLGWRNDVARVLPLFDLLVLPSRNEGMGRVLVEAMAAGLPVVASRVGGVPDLVAHGVNGLLVPPGEPPALAAAIGRILGHPDLARRMGESGRRRASRFSLETMVEKIDALYQELIPIGPYGAFAHAGARPECGSGGSDDGPASKPAAVSGG